MWICNCFGNIVYSVIAWVKEAQQWPSVTIKYCWMERDLIFCLFFPRVCDNSQWVFIPHIAVLFYRARTSPQSFEASHSEKNIPKEKLKSYRFFSTEDRTFKVHGHIQKGGLTFCVIAFSLLSSFWISLWSGKYIVHVILKRYKIRFQLSFTISMVCPQRYMWKIPGSTRPGPKLWNSLSLDVKKIKSFSSFRCHIKNSMIDGYITIIDS